MIDGDLLMSGTVDKPRTALSVPATVSTDSTPPPPSPPITSLTLDNITYTYPTRPHHPALSSLSLSIPIGKHTAIVGPSGSGKSTLASLLMRFYDPDSGSITINGSTEIRSLRPEAWRAQVGYVQQEPVLFTGTVYENIACGLSSRQSYTEEQVREFVNEALAMANALDFVSALPDGVDTLIGGQSTTCALSGGQKQRLGIARAVIGNRSLLILDEPTSKLDSVSETVVMDALEKIRRTGGGMTMVTIAHRLATIREADVIVVMEEGRVVETGDHESLMVVGGGKYRALVDIQTGAEERSKLLGGHVRRELGGSGNTSIDLKEPVIEESVSTPKTDDYTDTPKQLSMLGMLRKTLTYGRHNLTYSTIALAASTAAGAIIIAEALMFGNLLYLFTEPINSPTQSSLDRSRVNTFAMGFFLVGIGALVAYTISGIFFGLVAESLIFTLRNHSLATIMRKPLSFFAEPGHSPFHMVSAINADVASLASLSGVILGAVVSSSVSLLGGTALGLGYSWRIGVVLLPAVPAVVAAGFARIRILNELETVQQKAQADGIALALESCAAFKTVSALNLQSTILTQFDGKVNVGYKRVAKFVVHSGAWFALAIALPYYAYALAYWWGARTVRGGMATALEFFVVLPALLNSAQASGRIFSLAPEFTTARRGAKRIFGLIESDVPPIPPTITDEKAGSEKEGMTVGLKDVSLVYPSAPDRLVLDNVSLTIPPGAFIGIVGASGSGKSTVINVLACFYEPLSGSVTLNNRPLAQTLSLSDWRSRCAYVQQDGGILSGTIWENLLLGNIPDAAELDYNTASESIKNRVMEMLEDCGLRAFVDSLSDGLQTLCGAGGSQLSGGQRQRLALARALLRSDAVILLLDEATSALDAQTEVMVQEAIRKHWLQRGGTVVSVAHRIGTVRGADEIVVMESGRVIERGSHGELVGRRGGYWEMARRQGCVDE